MSAEWKTGALAVGTVRGVEGVRVMAGYGTAEPRLRWLTTDDRLVDADNDGWYFSYQVTDVRPLVVLDPADRREIERLRSVYLDDLRRQEGNGFAPVDVANALQETLHRFVRVDLTEPIGMGAVVEDIDGHWHVRAPRDDGRPWIGSDGKWRAWADVLAVRAVIQGVVLT